MAKSRNPRRECFVASPQALADLKGLLSSDRDDGSLATALDQLAGKYPNEVYIEVLAASMLGDAGQIISEEVEALNKKQAVSRLQKALETRKILPHYIVSTINNEIYYHSNLYYAQYIHGISEQREGWPLSGGFSIGVGASEFAFQKLMEGRIEQAKEFARKSINGWNDRAQGDADYLGKQTFYIMSLAMSGEREKARDLFKKHQSGDKHVQANRLWYERYQRRLDKIEAAIKSR